MLLAQVFPGVNGFLGTRGSFMLDFVFVALFAILPLLALSVYLVRYKRKYRWHKQLQLVLGIVLLVAVVAFEVDIQFITHPWEARAADSPYYAGESNDLDWSSPVGICLAIHLLFAVPTALLWTYVIIDGLRKIPNPPGPSAHSRWHMFWGRLAALGMLGTALTGWVFYWLAFVA